MIKQTIQVTEEDIRKGKSESCNSCPIARAIKREVDGVAKGSVSVNSALIEASIKGVPHYFTPKLNVEKFVMRFDNGLSVKPFKFVLEFEEELL